MYDSDVTLVFVFVIALALALALDLGSRFWVLGSVGRTLRMLETHISVS